MIGWEDRRWEGVEEGACNARREGGKTKVEHGKRQIGGRWSRGRLGWRIEDGRWEVMSRVGCGWVGHWSGEQLGWWVDDGNGRIQQLGDSDSEVRQRSWVVGIR